MFTGASIPERRWSRDNFIKVAEYLTEHGFSVVILGSKSDKKTASYIKKKVKDVVDLTGETNLSDVAHILKVSNMFLTVDSGLMHIAHGLGIPTVAIFGPSNEKKWSPRSTASVVINKHLECSPCSKFGYTPMCSYNARCISSISVKDVIESVGKIIGAAKERLIGN